MCPSPNFHIISTIRILVLTNLLYHSKCQNSSATIAQFEWRYFFMEEIMNYYKETTGNELDLNIEIKLTVEQENYLMKKLLKITTEITDVLYEWARVVYMNLIVQGKVGA